MRAVQRLKGLGCLFIFVIVVLGCYMVSLSVANERNKLARMNLKIAMAERDLRALGTEFDTRANMVQLERWNGEVLALTAPTAAQFVRDETQFASLVRTPGAGPEVKMAALVVPAGVTPIQTANAAAVAVVAATPAPAVAVAKVAVVQDPAPVVAVVRTAAAETKAKAVAMLDRKLLSDATLGDIMSGARAEAARGR